MTRWSPDGNAVAYVVAGTTIGISRLDGTTQYSDMPADLKTQRWRVVSYEWSSDSTRIAATLRAANGLSNTSDVYLVNAKAGSTFERITSIGDAFAGKWIDATRLFIEESSGAILVLDLASGALRPVTGLPATSPQIGRDGRLYFVGGTFVVSDVATQPVANGWVWSATIDGDDLRHETKDAHDQMRLFGMLADGRAVVGVPGGVYIAGDAYVPLAFAAGTVRRVVVSDDGKRLYGITDQRILLIDPAKVPRVPTTPLPPADAASVLLSSVREADVWFPSKAVTLARGARPSVEGPRAKLAFALGRVVWQSDAAGTLTPLLTEPTGFFTGVRWSPSGDRLAVGWVPPSNSLPAMIAVTGPAGTKRFEIPTRASVNWMNWWTADGRRLVTWITNPPRFDVFTTQLYDADSGALADQVPGRAAFTSGPVVVLSDGDNDPVQGIRIGQRIDVGGRAITDARKLGATLWADVPDPTLQPAINQFLPAADGSYVLVWIYRTRNAGNVTGAFAVVRASDGVPVWSIPLDPRTFLEAPLWSPVAPLLAWSTTIADRGTAATTRRTLVVDPATGRNRLTVEGRFAGWSPDGEWVYVARDDGLFAHRVDGGSVRVSAIGVPVAAAKP